MKKVKIHTSELEHIIRYVSDFRDLETGGDLFCYLTLDQQLVIALAIGPGKQARHWVTSFYQDVDYLMAVGKVAQNYGLHYNMNFHSHHHLGLKTPSGHDEKVVRAAMEEHGLVFYLMIIATFDQEGKVNLNGYWFERGQSGYQEVTFHILEGESPFCKDIKEKYPDLLLPPNTQTAELGQIQQYPTKPIPHTFRLPWLENEENVNTFKKLCQKLKEAGHNLLIQEHADESLTVGFSKKNGLYQGKIDFPKDYPEKGACMWVATQEKPILQVKSFVQLTQQALQIVIHL